MTREEEIYNAMGDAEWKHVDGTKDIELFDMGFKEGAEWADVHPHWISVEGDGNPKDTGWYIFTTGKIVDVGYYLGGNEWRNVHPTHWMPLPQLPILSNLENI